MGEKGLLAEAVRVLGSEMRQIREILDEGLTEMVDAMGRWMEDHQPEVLEEEWHSEEEAEEKQVFREFLKERARLRDVVQAALVRPKGVTEAPANNEGNVVEGDIVEGGVAEGGVNGDSAVVGGTEPIPEN